MIDQYRAMTEEEREEVEIYAVNTGEKVQFCSSWSEKQVNYRLDNSLNCSAWTAGQFEQNTNSWIQVCTPTVKTWVAVIIQGRGDLDQWVQSVKISYTRNGNTWKFIDNGKVFQACQNRYQKIRIDFSEAVEARVVRIHPQTFKNHVSLRFDAIYLDM